MSNLIKSAPPKTSTPNGLPAMAGIGMGLAVFILLPVAQWIDAMTTRHTTTVDVTEMPPPPPMMVIEEPKDDNTEQEQLEDLKQDQPPPSLDMLELSFSTNLSGIGTGDFAMPSFDVGEDLENMIFELKDLDERPRPTVQTKPQYPLDLRQAGINGKVEVEFLVDPRGNVRNVKIISSTNPGFDESVLRAVRTWRFEPGKKNGKKVTVRVRVPIPFNTR
ncbi:MAG: energy transducer TonB [Opitutales bacterium]|nr:energy transducer TonB [Opitutales bacterium]